MAGLGARLPASIDINLTGDLPWFHGASRLSAFVDHDL
jgi:hypothetical protein